MRAPAFAFLALMLAACVPEGGARGEGAGSASREACPIIESALWYSWLGPNRDGPGGVLAIGARVTTPTPGYSFSWVVGPTDRGLPPGQHLTLIVSPPDGMVAQVLTETDIEFSLATPFTEFRTVIVSCGETVIHKFGRVRPLE